MGNGLFLVLISLMELRFFATRIKKLKWNLKDFFFEEFKNKGFKLPDNNLLNVIANNDDDDFFDTEKTKKIQKFDFIDYEN